MKSLAEALGVGEPAPEKQDTKSITYTDAKSFCDAIVASDEFRSYILNGLRMGDLPAALTNRILDHSSWGVVAKKVEVTKTNNVEKLSDDELIKKLEVLSDLVRRLRMNESADIPDDTGPSAIH